MSRGRLAWLLLPLLALPAAILSTYRLEILALVAAYTLAALAQNLLVGYADVPSLGNVSFFAVSAYTCGSLLVLARAPALLAIAGGITAAGILGLVIGLPALRISGMHLAIVTVALVFVAQEIMEQWDQAHDQLTGGLTVTSVPGVLQGRGLYLTAVVLMVLGYVTVGNILRGKTGRALLALSQNPTAAAAAGIDPIRYRLLAFVLSGLVTGVGGIIFLYYGLTVTPPAFSLDLSLAFLTMIIVGGRRSLGGSLVGGLIIGLLPQALALLPSTIGNLSVADATSALYALLLLAALRFFPNGLWDVLSRVASERAVPLLQSSEPRP